MKIFLYNNFTLVFLLSFTLSNIQAQTSPIISALENKEKVNIKKTKLSGRFDEISPTFNYQESNLYYVLGTGPTARTSKKARLTAKGTLDVWKIPFNDKLELGEPEKVEGEMNSYSNDGPICFYDNGNKVMITRNAIFNKKTQSFETNNNKMFFIPLQIFTLEKVNNQWTNITLLDINKSKYSFAHPTISPSGNKLILSSNSPSSYGKNDLYITEMKNGEWSKLKNLGRKINTDKQEVFPQFIDENTILFSTDGRKGVGRLDIYYTNLTVPNPKLLAAPVNSAGDDFGVAIYKDKKHWLISSNRTQATGMDDIFMIWIGDKENPKTNEVTSNKKNNDTKNKQYLDYRDSPSLYWGLPEKYNSYIDKNIDYQDIINIYYYEQEAINDIYIVNKLDTINDETLSELNINKSNLTTKEKTLIGPFYDIKKAEKKRKELILKGYLNCLLYFYRDNKEVDITIIKELLTKNQ